MQQTKSNSSAYLLKVSKSNNLPDVDRETLAFRKDLYYQIQMDGLFKPIVDKRPVYDVKRDPKKQDVEDDQLREQSRKDRSQNLKYVQSDGVFKAGQETGLSMWNVKRLEQMLIVDEKFNYFNQDGELVMDNEFFEEKIQRIMILDYEDYEAFQTYQRPATRCSRENQNKALPFRLDIFIGVLQFSFHPKFSREDQHVSDLKYLIRKYRERADLALIPHYKKTREILLKEAIQLKMRPDDTKQEQQMIQKEIQKIETKLEDEKIILEKIMTQVQSKWDMIKQERKSHDYISSPYKLGIRQYRSNENTDETEFILLNCEVSKETNAKLPLSRLEEGRRQEVRQNVIQLEIIVNNKVMARTRKVNLDWPNFEVRFMEKLSVYVFTKPSTVKMRILKCQFFKKVIGEIDIELPGEKAHSMTSSGFVLKEAYFALGREQIRKSRYKDLVLVPQVQNVQNDVEEYEGFISYRTEWPDFGPKMPPDSLDMQYQKLIDQYEDEFTEVDEKVQLVDDELFDLNDPRNEQIFDDLARRGGQVDNDIVECPVPYGNVYSKRQQLLKQRFIQPKLGEFKIPLIDQQIERDANLIQFLEEEEEAQNYHKELRLQNKQGEFQILEDFINDVNTQKRLLEIQNILQQRRIEAKLKQHQNQGGLITLENVVNEFHFEAAASLLAQCIKSIFTKRRKLGPQKRSVLEKKSVTQISEVQISILIVQGNNVPIRTTAIEELHNIKNKILSNQGLQAALEQQQQIDQVCPAIQVQLDLESANLFLIKQLEKKVKVDKKASQAQLGQIMGFDDDSQTEEFKIDYIRLAEEKQAIESTCEVKGVNPEWNQLVDFKIGRERENQQFDAIDVINSKNKIIITLFDQIAHSKQKQANQVLIGIDKWYLGSITIPLINLFQQDTLNGTFRINRPLLLLNYRTLNVENFLNDVRFEKQSKQEQNELHKQINITDPHVPTTIELTMTLDPQIKLNEDLVNTSYFPGAESTNLFLYGIRQLNRYKEKFKSRFIKFWAENLKGESVYLPRFLTPLRPPEIDNTSNPIEKVARYVSLIPFKNDTEAFKDLPDIYCNCQEFLDLRAGDFEEHALLLCCFFMYIDKEIHKRDDVKNYVVMGRGLPEGKTQYVMRRLLKNNIVELWNPQTGEPFVFQNVEVVKSLLCFTISKGYQNLNQDDDQACPLRSIGCIFDDKNIYINIQESDNPSEMDFNIDNPHFWEPFLNADQQNYFFPKGISTMQHEIQFDQPDIDRALRTQQSLEKFLESKIEEYRRNQNNLGRQFTTTFVKQRHAELSDYIRDNMLLNLETFKYKIRTTQESKIFRYPDGAQQGDPNDAPLFSYQDKLKQLSKYQSDFLKRKDKLARSKEIYGFPLNFPFIDLDRAWDEVKATGIANITSDELEYLCIVKCFPYPHYIISCWVFIAVLYIPRAID